MPEGVTFHIHENGSGTCHLILPKKPEGELSEEEISKNYKRRRVQRGTWERLGNYW